MIGLFDKKTLKDHEQKMVDGLLASHPVKTLAENMKVDESIDCSKPYEEVEIFQDSMRTIITHKIDIEKIKSEDGIVSISSQNFNSISPEILEKKKKKKGKGKKSKKNRAKVKDEL